MKYLFSATLLLSSMSLGQVKAETGFQALFAMHTSSVVEVSGVRGQDQPGTWRVTRMEPAGPVDYYVRQGRVQSAQPARRAVPQAEINQSRLRYDSTHAFARANEIAQKAKVGFDSANYRLQSNGESQYWEVQLIDLQNLVVGYARISSYSGEVVDRKFQSGYLPPVQNYAPPTEQSWNGPQNYQSQYSPPYQGGWNGGGSPTPANNWERVGNIAATGVRKSITGIGNIFRRVVNWASTPSSGY
jgi:hypothetical protein